jgi:hypothetical protein
MEMEEIVKILVAVVVLMILVGMVAFLFKGGGSEIFDSIREILRFGR